MSSLAAAPGAPPVNRAMVTVAVMMATTVVLLDLTIATIALPHMQGGLSATQDRIAWVMTTYFMFQAITTACTGWLAGRLGRKRLFVLTLIGFSVCAVLSGNATSLPEILVYRAFQGMFSAPVIPISQALMLDSYPPERHGEAIAIWGTGVVFAPVMGPVIGGWLTDAYGWQWVFYVGIPFTLLAVALAVLFVRETEIDRARRFDWFGFTALALALVALQLLLDRGEFKGWFDSTEIIVEAGLVILGIYLFVVHSATTGNPFISHAIWRDRNMVVGLVFMFLLGVFVLTMNVLLPMYMQTLRGFPVFTAGLLMAPRGLGTFFSLMAAGYLVRWFNGRLIIAVGFACVAISAHAFSTFTPDVGIASFITAATINGLGIGLIWVPLTSMAFATLAPQYRTEGSTLTSLCRNYGSGVGVSVVIGILTRTRAVSHAQLTENVTPYSEVMRAPFLPESWSIATPQGLSALQAEISRQAMGIGFINDFTVLWIGAIVCVPLVILMRRGPKQGRGAAAE